MGVSAAVVDVGRNGWLFTNRSLSSYGYLPGRLFPLLPFFGALPLPRCAVVTLGRFLSFVPFPSPTPLSARPSFRTHGAFTLRRASTPCAARYMCRPAAPSRPRPRRAPPAGLGRERGNGASERSAFSCLPL